MPDRWLEIHPSGTPISETERALSLVIARWPECGSLTRRPTGRSCDCRNFGNSFKEDHQKTKLHTA